jgi:hypothetical protein
VLVLSALLGALTALGDSHADSDDATDDADVLKRNTVADDQVWLLLYARFSA